MPGARVDVFGSHTVLSVRCCAPGGGQLAAFEHDGQDSVVTTLVARETFEGRQPHPRASVGRKPALRASAVAGGASLVAVDVAVGFRADAEFVFDELCGPTGVAFGAGLGGGAVADGGKVADESADAPVAQCSASPAWWRIASSSPEPYAASAAAMRSFARRCGCSSWRQGSIAGSIARRLQRRGSVGTKGTPRRCR